MKKYILKVEDKIRLDVLLRKRLPEIIETEISNSKIRRLIFSSSVFINSNPTRNPSLILNRRTKVEIHLDTEKLLHEKKCNDIEYTLTEKDVIYEDDYIIVVDKPAFLPSEKTFVNERNNMKDCVINYLWSKNKSLANPPYIGMHHRLDRETSGVLLFSKSRSVNKNLHEQFENHTITKKYRAVCVAKNNVPKEKKFIVEGNMFRVSAKSEACKMGLSKTKDGLYSRTQFVIKGEKNINSNKIYYIDCELETGRTHQIRVHLASTGLPIAGDKLYGADFAFRENNERIMLHSFELGIKHPVSGETMIFKSKLPELFDR